MIRTKQETSRAEFVRQRRSSKAGRADSRRYASTASFVRTSQPRLEPRKRMAQASTRTRQQYEFGFSPANARVKIPAISLPQFNMRWVSGILTGILVFVLYAMWNSSTFTVYGVKISGNARLNSTDIEATLDLNDKPVFLVNPSELETLLRSEHRDLSSAKVRVQFPNRISVVVSERVPVIAWYEGQSSITWIDANGVAFPPRGSSETLINVVANDTPPMTLDENKPDYEQAMVPPEMVQALISLKPFVPENVPLVYDPDYGMGWQDSHGWQVFFGQTTNDISLKIATYQAIVDTLVREGRNPSMVDLAYVDAPYIK